MLPRECTDWLVSKGCIDDAGSVLYGNPNDFRAQRMLDCYRRFRLLSLDQNIHEVLSATQYLNVLLAARLKRQVTIVRKLTRFEGMKLSRMADVIGLRFITDGVHNADRLVAALEKLDCHKKTIDYCEKPQDSGYRARHVIIKSPCTFPGNAQEVSFDVEVQVRTYFQHLWALVSERFGERVKEGGGSEAKREYLAELSNEIMQHEEEHADEVQIGIPISPEDFEMSVVARPASPGESPRILSFGENYRSAINQVLAWESSLGDSPRDPVLLAGAGGLETLGVTHSTILGKEIDLPEWMPQFEYA